MEQRPSALSAPFSISNIASKDGGPGDAAGHHPAFNSSSPMLNNAVSPSQATRADGGHGGGDPTSTTTVTTAANVDADDPAQSGRKRRVSFKDKQRQSISHLASTTTRSVLPADSVSRAAIQSPVSNLSSLSPQQSDFSSYATQSLQPASKSTTTDATTTKGSIGIASPASGCVFTALEPTRLVGGGGGGLRGAAKPPNRGFASHASPTQSATALSVSPFTSAEPSPLNHKASSPVCDITPSTSLMQSPVTRVPPGPGEETLTSTTTASATGSSASPLTMTSANPFGHATGRGFQSSGEMGGPEHSLDGILSSVSASSPKSASSSSAVASPKMSFKDRQRAAAAAAGGGAAGASSPSSRIFSARASVPSQLNRAAPLTNASVSFALPSPSHHPSVAEASVNEKAPQSSAKPGALPSSAAIQSPTVKASLHVDPTASSSSPPHQRSTSSGKGSAGNSPVQHIPRLPMECVDSGHSPHPSYTASNPTGIQTTQQQQQQQQTGVGPSLPPLTLPLTSAGVNVTSATAGYPFPLMRSTQSAPATEAERLTAATAHGNPLLTSSGAHGGTGETTNTDSTVSHSSGSHTVVTQMQSRSSQTHTSSRAEDDEDDDEENPALNFTQNTARQYVYEGDEPSPHPHAMATTSHDQRQLTGGSSEGGSKARSGTILERSNTTGGGSGGGGAGGVHSSSCSRGSERRPLPTRRARTNSLDSPPPHTGTVPPSPSPGVLFTASLSSHSPRKLPTGEKDWQGCRPPNITVDHWKKHSKPHPNQQQQQHFHLQHQLSHTSTISTSQEISLLAADPRDDAEASSGSIFGNTSRSRARRYRGKMLAPDGAVISTPRTGRGPGGETGSSAAFTNPLPPRMHGRSYTVDDFSLYAGSTGRRGTLTPSAVTPSSVLFTASPFPVTLVPAGTTAAHAPGAAGTRSHAGPLESSGSHIGPHLPLSPYTSDTMSTADIAATGGRSLQASSLRQRTGLVAFPALPPLHDHTNPSAAVPTGSSANALSRVSYAMAAVLIPSAQSAENISVATPVAVATPKGYRSSDERSSNEASRGNQTEKYAEAPLAKLRSHTTMPEEEEDGEGGDHDYLFKTYNTYYGGEASVSATTAELRKSRRRSNYSSLHYGTMTGYKPRGDSRRPRSSSAVQHKPGGRQRHQTSTAHLAATAKGLRGAKNEEEEEEDTKRRARRSPEPLTWCTATMLREGLHSPSDRGNEESICEQKGSEGQEVEQPQRIRPPRRRPHRSNTKQLRKGGAGSGDAGVAALCEDDDDDAEGSQRRTVGVWETIEHIFLPRYELVPDAVLRDPLIGPASPNSPHPSGNGSSGNQEVNVGEGSSPLMANLKSSSSSPKAQSSHGPPQQHQQQALLLASPRAQVKSPYSAATNPVSLSTQNSPSLGPTGGPRPSGLVVLPDAANLCEDPSSSTSLTFSQFRKTPAQTAGTKRLEPEKFTFGTVAANYNTEPTEEQNLPEGAADAKVAARLIFEAATGVMLMDPEDEGGRYAPQDHTSPDALSRSSSFAPRANEEGSGGGGSGTTVGEEGEGACQCSASFIAKDFKGLDCSRYDASDLYDHCSRCHRRPASFLCLHCLEAVCPSHVHRHHLLNPTQCTLFLNLLDIMSSFDRIFWCEKCRQFTWKYTEVYDAMVDQIAYTRGTYLKHPARDIHCVGYEVRLKDATAGAATATAAAAAAAAILRVKSEHSISDDATSSTRGSPARLRRAVSGSSMNPVSQGLAPNPGLATFPTISCSSVAASPPQTRSGTPPAYLTANHNHPHVGGSAHAPPPAVLRVNNLIVFGASPSSPMGGNGGASRLHTNAIGTPSLRPLTSPMQHMLSRDPMEASCGRTVTVGEPVTKLCALGASVQGWRTTQEDAEAVFLVDIPALSNEVVDRKELRAAAAAAAADKKKKKEERENQQQQQQQDGSTQRSTSSNLLSTSRPAPAQGDEEEGGNAAKIDAPTSNHVQPIVSLFTSCGTPSPLRPRSGATPLEGEGDAEEDAALQKEKDDDDDAAPPAAKETIPMAVFCVFDGHGGDAVAKLAARHFETHLRRAIDRTRSDDVRARALLFYLNAESNAAALVGPQPAVTAIPAADGSFTFLPAHSAAAFAAAAPAAAHAVQRGSMLMGTSSPPPLLPSPPNPAAFRHSGNITRTSSSQSRLLVPSNSQVRTFDGLDADAPNATALATPSTQQQQSGLPAGEEDNDMPQILQLPDALYAESIPVVMPVTAESLRLHMAGSTINFPGSTDNASGVQKAHLPPSNLGQDSAAGGNLQRNRRSKTGLDAWADVDPQTDMATSSAAAAAAAAASPPTAKLFSTSLAGSARACGGGGGAHGCGSYGTSSPQVAVAASSAYYPSTTAVVSIPEMEMLRQYFASIMEDALLSLDSYLRSTPEGQRGDYDCVGCTACVVGITANFVLCANVGDSGAAFYTKDRIKVISVKHRVSDATEQERISAAGYSIVNGRIEGMSAVPRALGDFDFKQCGGRGPREQAVSAVPDVTIMPTPSDTDRWGIILACDGVWDTATLHQVHVALTNTMNDLDVASSATEAVLRGAELFQHHLRGPGAPRGDSPSSSPHRSSTSGGGGVEEAAAAKHGRSRDGSTAPSPAKRRALIREERGEGSVIGDEDGDEGEARRLPQVDPLLLTAAAGVFAQCVAPADNDEGVGLDNCSLIIVQRRNVQE